MTQVARSMLAVQGERTSGSLAARHVPVPHPAGGEVLVRVAAAPINPSDFRFLAGSGADSAPVVPGLEGSGTVVASGGGLLPRLLRGRRVAFATTRGGTWAEYAVARAAHCVPLRHNVSLEQGATLIVNPMTAMAFLDMAKRGGHEAIVNNAAASALGRMIVRLGRTRGVGVISVVRRPEQAQLLRGLGAEHVLDSSDRRFALELRELAERLKATLLFDAVGGTETQTLIEAAPPSSTIVVYAALSGERSAFDARTLAGQDKKIAGFYLGNWMAQAGVVRTLRNARRVQRLVHDELQTTIQARFPLSDAQAAAAAYRANMTAGKVLLVADV